MLDVEVGALVVQFAESLKPCWIGAAKILDTDCKLTSNPTRRSVPTAYISRLNNNRINR